ncbi:SDR family NAD(P)-dependent oxidoreductase [Tenacibaculum sp. MEBiC06402]|uniref:SDR family NAD(P)-dependent oxidoreductase n=1 Tax=unclassified Tenacibaculum TaxID=2635139 RepID=UPI003B9B6246
MSNIVIITGGSKGIGNALAKKYSSENYIVYSLSRSITGNKNLKEISINLLNFSSATHTFSLLLNNIIEHSPTSITLINNAGRLGNIGNLENIPTHDIEKSILLNTTIPLAFSSIFIEKFANLNCKKQIISISSGAATKPYNGWSIYCSSKAALDMMTATIGQEQIEVENSVQAYGIRPGVVDTNMQSQIRETSVDDFKNVQRFINLKENNELYTPEFVAQRIFDLDTQNKLKNGETIDLRNF